MDAAALARCREAGVALSYDPVQIGWVLADCEDDVDPPPAEEGAVAAARCRLRPWREDDVAAFVALLDDPEIWRHLPEPYPAPLTAAMARDLIAVSNASPHHEVRAVEVGGAPVGQVRLLFARPGAPANEAEISYWIGRGHWGRGIGAEAVRLYTELSLGARPELAALFARVAKANAASERLLARAGYRPAGDAPDDGSIRIWRRARDGRA